MQQSVNKTAFRGLFSDSELRRCSISLLLILTLLCFPFASIATGHGGTLDYRCSFQAFLASGIFAFFLSLSAKKTTQPPSEMEILFAPTPATVELDPEDIARNRAFPCSRRSWRSFLETFVGKYEVARLRYMVT